MDAKEEAYNLDHHGLVAAIMKKMNLANIIDSLIPKISNNPGIPYGKSVEAMILNGLGFVERRLYMVSSFFDNKPIEKLLGDGITAADLNDDQIGRTLDALYNFGLTEMFFYIMAEVGEEYDLFNGLAHLDSTTFSVYGEYDTNETEVKITNGHSKDHRPELKQMTLNMAVSGKGGIPFWMEPLSGNSSDKKSFHETIETYQKFKQELGKGPAPIWIADSALYTIKRLLKNDLSFYWISRVPENINEARAIIELENKKIEWKKLDDGYSVYSFISEYKGIKQSWVLVHSEEAMKRELITFEKKVEKEEDTVWKEIQKLEKTVFHCSQEAEKYYQKLKKTLEFYRFSHKKIEPIYQLTNEKTRTGKQKKKISGYKLKVIMAQNKETIEKKRNTKGRFILATNFIDDKAMTGEDILREYKNQSKVEKGFRFLKDTSFLLSDIYVKRPERFQALLFIMTLTLAVYCFGEYLIRKELKTNKETYPNQLGKKVNNPTLKWIFQSMRGVILLETTINNKVIEKIFNIKEHYRSILKCFGEETLGLYGFT